MEYLNQPHESPKNGAVTRPQEAVGLNSYYEAGFERADESDSMVMEYLRILRRHRGKIILFALAGLALGVVVTALQTPVYRATTSLEVLNLNEDFMNLKQSNPVSDTDSSYDTSEVQTQVKILQNEELLDRVVSKLDPGYKPAQGKPPVSVPVTNWRAWLSTGWRTWLKMPLPGRSTPRQALLNRAAKSLKVRATPRTRIVEITIDSTDPQLASDFANVLDNEFIQQNLEARWKTTQRMGDWLSRELADARDKLAAAENALQTYARNSGLIFTSDDSNVATEKLQQIQQALSAASADRIGKQSRYELAQAAPPDALPEVLNDQGYRDTQAKLSDLRRQIAELSAIYNPDYNKLKQAQAQVSTLQSSIDRNRLDIVARIKNDYMDALRRENLLAASYDKQTHEVTGQDEKAIQYNILKREVESSRQLYDVMLQQLKQSSIATAIHASNVRIVDPAKTPFVPASPSLPMDAGIGLLFGLVAGVGVAFIRERADRTLQQPGHAQFWTDLPELGVIPSANFEGTKKLSGGYGLVKMIEESPNGKAGIKVRRSKESVELITWERSPSFMAEAFRTVLTSILFIGENGSSPRMLVFTSAASGDGKTTVVSNLAIALAEIGRKVLVIDADLRRPRQHKIFDVPNDAGLSTLLKSLESKPDAWTDLIRETKIPGLSILPSGPATQAAANLLYSPRLTELLAKVKREYDMVLVDTPPMLQMTDARVVGRMMDAVILVARAERTTRDALIAATKRLGEDRIRVLGTILNDWNPKRSPNGYYGYYGGSYNYKTRKDEAELSSLAAKN
jgi:succinoglycan biosynthesis transport protein ExoP